MVWGRSLRAVPGSCSLPLSWHSAAPFPMGDTNRRDYPSSRIDILPQTPSQGFKRNEAPAFPGQDQSRHVRSTFRSPLLPTPGAKPAQIHVLLANSHTAQSQGLIQRARKMRWGRIQPRWEPALKESKLFPAEKAQYCPTVSPTGAG